MKRFRPGYELVFDGSLLLVGSELPLLRRDLVAGILETDRHHLGGGLRIEVMDGHFEQFSGQEAALDRTRLGVRNGTFFRLDAEDPQCGLISGQRKVNIQGMLGCPINQLLRGVTPAQAEGGLDDGLAPSGAAQSETDDGSGPDGRGNGSSHGGMIHGKRQMGKKRCRRGFVLVEATLALSILTVLGLLMLKMSLNILTPRQWGLSQTLSDAHLTYERAYAQRIPFETLTGPNSPWPLHPSTSTTVVEIGRLPGDVPIMGTVVRTRTDASPPLATNPAAMSIFRVQSVLTYQIGGRNYVKSRTVVRAQ